MQVYYVANQPKAGNKEMISVKKVVALIVMLALFVGFVGIYSAGAVAKKVGKAVNKGPKVVSTNPPTGTQNVSPLLTEISVTFNKQMMDNSWSWCYIDKNAFPQMTGKPYYTENNTKNILPVKLEPNKEYVICINTQKFKGFKDKAGNPADPYKFTFKTKL